MDSVYDGLLQIEHNEGIQLSSLCLRIPHILRQLLEYFSNSELLQLSVVNKQWNYEARSVIKDRGTMNAHLDTHQLCKDLAVFASHVRQMNVVPYSGICVYFDHDEEDEDPSLTLCEALGSSFDVILNRMPLKHFGVEIDRLGYINQGSLAFIAVKKILQDHCSVLESLNVGLPCDDEYLIDPIFAYCTFIRLKTLKLWQFPDITSDACETSIDISSFSAEGRFLEMIVSQAPNLQVVHLDRPAVGYQGLLEGSSAVLVVDSETDPLIVGMYPPRIRDGLIGGLRLTRMRLEYSRNFSMNRFNRIVPAVLQISSSVLQKLSLESVFAPSFMRYGIRLKNVKKLTINLNGQELEVPQCMAADVPALFGILRDFDFTYIFPKLNEVKISISDQEMSPQEISQFVDQGNVARRRGRRRVVSQEPNPDRAVNIKHLKIQHLPMNVPFLASVFPHIGALTVEIWGEPAPPFVLIWEHWAHLKHLVVHAEGLWQQNWDCLFCGLFPEEIAQLREEDDEYLKAVNIVPVMPSITCMKELQSFTLSNTKNAFVYDENDPTYIPSKVLALIAFSRCPNLSVTLKINSNLKNAWRHMKNCANIVLVD